MAVRVSGRSRRSLEEELGLGSSVLSKILGGTVRLQMSHVLAILDAVHVDPADFFRMAYQGRRLKESQTLKDVRALLQKDLQDEPEAIASSEEESPEFEEKIRRVLLRMLAS